jgi:hypothetical protein
MHLFQRLVGQRLMRTRGVVVFLFQYDSTKNRFQCFYRRIRTVIRYTAKVPSQCEPT